MAAATLTTQRLVLRPYTEGERGEFIALNCDSLVRRHMNGPLTVDAAAALFERILSGETGDGSIAWAVVENIDGGYLGHVFLDADSDRSEAELGFLFRPPYWGRGFATEVVTCVADYAFEETGIARILATVDADHAASMRVLEKAGFTRQDERCDDDGTYYVYALNRASCRG